MNKVLIKQKIRQYIELSCLAATFSQNNNLDPVLISAIIDLEEEILIQFGLPPSVYQYTSQMEYYSQSDGNTDDIVNKLYRCLKNEAIAYLTSPVKSNIEILNDGKEKMLHANEVIPFTGYATTSYNSFVYHDIFCRDRCSTKVMMNAIVCSEGNSEFDSAFQSLPFAKEFFEYRQSVANHKLGLVELFNPAFHDQYPVDSTLPISNFFITGFSVYDHHTAILECAIKCQVGLVQIKIWCTLKHLQFILLHSKYLSDVSSALLQLRYHSFSDKPYLFDTRSRGMVIEIVEINFELERMGRNAEEDYQPSSFIISYLPEFSRITNK